MDVTTQTSYTAAQLEEMTAELLDLAPEEGQHESLMRARWGGDYSADLFAAACSASASQREARTEQAADAAVRS